MNWRATPLVSYRVIVDPIAATTTTAGLSVQCLLDTATYPKGITVTDMEMAQLSLIRDEFHGDWNDTLKPKIDPSNKAIIS